MKLLIIFIVSIIKFILNKIFALIIFLILTLLKGKVLKYDSKDWDKYLLSVSLDKMVTLTAFIYLVSSVASSAVAYKILLLFNIKHAFAISCILFFISLLITALRYKKNGKEYLQNKLNELHIYAKEDMNDE